MIDPVSGAWLVSVSGLPASSAAGVDMIARRSAVAVPADRLLVETDAPSIGLEGVSAEGAEPRHTLDVVNALARLRGEPPVEVAARTTANARALFNLAT